MCRSIKPLRDGAVVLGPDDVTAAARQFVRKVSGYHHPSKANEPAFEQAIAEIAEVTHRLLAAVTATHPDAARRAS
jgi:hypothetical protein